MAQIDGKGPVEHRHQLGTIINRDPDREGRGGEGTTTTRKDVAISCTDKGGAANEVVLEILGARRFALPCGALEFRSGFAAALTKPKPNGEGAL